MSGVIVGSKIHPLRRLWALTLDKTIQRWRHSSQLRSIKQKDQLIDIASCQRMYSDKVGYSYKLFDFQEEESIYKFMTYSDLEIGGDSTVELIYQRDRRCLVIQGLIDASDREKLIQHPSIGIQRVHDYPFKCGPFNALQLQIQSDGEPIHIGLSLESKIEAIVPCYGVVTSKLKGWYTYEIPIQNMLVVGAETGHRSKYDYTIPGNANMFYDKSAYDARRILLTQADEPVIRDLNIRLLNSSTTWRSVSLRNIMLVRRMGSQSFLKRYRQPFFYLVEKEDYKADASVGVSWLKRGYKEMRSIDLGDKVYHMK